MNFISPQAFLHLGFNCFELLVGIPQKKGAAPGTSCAKREEGTEREDTKG